MKNTVKLLWMCRIGIPLLWAIMPIVWFVGLFALPFTLLFKACCRIEEVHGQMRAARPTLARWRELDP